MNEKRLGRGLEFLISETALEGEEVRHLSISDLNPNPFQPRKDMDQDSEKELAASIKAHGILMPIIVRRTASGFEIVAGERRWRASKRVGLGKVPCIVRKVEDEKMLELALVENIQRRDLDPMEKARAFDEMKTRMNLTQEEIAGRLGMSRAAVANFTRLLELPQEIQDHVSRGTISFGHAKALMSLEDKEEQDALVRRILAEGLSVREAEKATKKTKGSNKKKFRSSQLSDMAQKLMEKLGTKVRIVAAGKGGQIIIDFYSLDDFDRIFELLE